MQYWANTKGLQDNRQREYTPESHLEIKDNIAKRLGPQIANVDNTR